MRLWLTLGMVMVLVAPAGAQRRIDEAKARVLYDDAVRRYDLAEYDKAIEEFKQVYLMTNRPELLFNLGQAHRAKHEYETALHFFRTYLKFKPDAPNRVEVRAWIDELEKAARETPPPLPPAPSLEKLPEKPPETAPEKPPEKPPEAKPELVAKPIERHTRPPFLSTTHGKATMALAAVSVATLIGAAAFGGVAVSRRGDYDASCNRGLCDDSLYTQGRSLAIGSDVLLSIGIASAAAAVIVVVVRPKKPLDLAWRF